MSENNFTVKIVGLLITGCLILSLLYVVSTTPFPHASYPSRELLSIQRTDELGGGMSNFLWDFRGLDLLMQTLILFATAISCLALLREEKR